MDGEPKSVFTSNRLAEVEPLRLRDFQWLGEKRPKNALDVFAN
jgi:hypothetical protein